MFRVSLPSSPTYRLAPLTQVLESGETANRGPIARIATASSIATLAATAPVDGVVTVTLPADVQGVSSVRIGNASYSQATSSTVAAGQYRVVGNELAIALRAGEDPAGLSVAYGAVTAQATVRNLARPLDVALPPTLQNWNLEGEIEITRSFESEPSCRLKFKTANTNLGAIASQFQPRTRLDINGIPFAVSVRPAYEELSDAKYPAGWIQADVQLRGAWGWDDQGIEKPIKLLSLVGTNPLPYPVTLQSIAAAAGIPLAGTTASLNIPRDTAPDATTTVAQALGDRVRLEEGFLFHSATNALQVRRWGATQTHYVVDGDLLDSPKWNFGGDQFQHEGIELAAVYKNTAVTLDSSESDEERKPLEVLIYVDPPGDPSVPPPEYTTLSLGDRKTLRECSNVFDQGGPIRKRTKTKTLGGQPIEIEEIKYGFVYTALDVYNLTSAGGVDRWDYDDAVSANTYWQKIEETRTVYRYDDLGYLVQIEKTGWKLGRLRQENSFDTLSLQTDINKASAPPLDAQKIAVLPTIQETLTLFTNFQRTPIASLTNYELSAHANYYNDVPTPQRDPSVAPGRYIESRFVQAEETTDDRKLEARNPTATADPAIYNGYEAAFRALTKAQPTVTNGQEFKNVKRVQIRAVRDRPDQDTFSVVAKTSTREGNDLINALNLGETTTNKGRPGTQTRIDFEAPGAAANRAANQVNGRYLLNTRGNGIGVDYPEQGSVQYATYDPNVARLAAEVDSSIANTQNCKQLQLRIPYRGEIQEGDRVIFRGETFVVFSVQYSLRIRTRAIDCPEGMSLQLGRYLRPAIDMVEVPLKQG